MRTLFLTLVTALFALQAFSQQGDTTSGDPLTFTQERDSAFAPLNKSRIPHGILYDRVFQFARLDKIATDDTLSVMHWIQGVSELERACISSL